MRNLTRGSCGGNNPDSLVFGQAVYPGILRGRSTMRWWMARHAWRRRMPGGGRILRIVHEDAIPVIKHVLLAHGQVYAHASTATSSLSRSLISMVSLNSGQRCSTASMPPTVNSTMRSVFRVKVLGVALQCAEHLQTAEVAQRFGQFKRAVRACQQGQVVEALTLLWIGERGGDAVSPLFLGIAVRIGGAVDRNRFDLMQDG